jgi:hypothetical protein
MSDRGRVLKNSFRGTFTRNFVCELLNVRSPTTLRFSKITALVLFQQPLSITLITVLEFFRTVRGPDLVDYARYNENFVLVVTSSCCIRWNSTGYQGRSPWLVCPLSPFSAIPLESAT